MRSRRLACLLLGMWLAGGFLTAWVRSQSISSAERLFDEDPAVMVMLKTIGPTAGRALLRHQVAEQNRQLLENWEYAQIFIGIFFFAFLLLGTREGKVPLALALLMLLLVLAQRFALTPELIYRGRPLDFAAKGGPVGDRARYTLVESSYLGVELVKWAAGLVLAVMFIFRRQRRAGLGYTRQEINLIDKADNGHVNR
jgi:hypothetical protein